MSQRGVVSPPSRIPDFATREEEAAFWDTHDIGEYWDELEPVEIEFETPLSEQITLSIDRETMAEVRAAAAERGMPVDLILFLWIVERRDTERARRAHEAEPAGRPNPAGSAR